MIANTTDCGEERRLILFGAFDRHNFGDLLLAHCAAAANPGRAPVFTGLLSRDLSTFGGHPVLALDDVVATYGDEPADFVHVGGEILTTTAWEAAVMLQSRTGAARAIALHDRTADSRRAYAAAVLGSARGIPYALSADELPHRWATHFNAVGGVAFDSLANGERAGVLHALDIAGSISVRDAVTRAALGRAGIAAKLVADPATAAPLQFGTAIAARAASGEIAALARRMPAWIAVQLAAAWGDDATLERLAAILPEHAAQRHAGIVLFRTGLAPWHDDIETLDRLAAHLHARAPGLPVSVLESPHVFDICAVLAGARAYLGTSLHAWIVANSLGIPARCLVQDRRDKAAAYLDTWHPAPRRWQTLADTEPLPRA